MEIRSPAFENGGQIPSAYSCEGERRRPALQISGVPSDAASLALIVQDPDSPLGTWVHWVVWNIPAHVREIPESGLPEGTFEGITSFGDRGYGPPCPHEGRHEYVFMLYALDTVLELEEGTDAEDLSDAMAGHILEAAELVGTYQLQRS